jgi:hypothetical protein
MANKTITFDATEVTTTVRTANYISVSVETDYLNEVLDNFTPDEIVSEYDQLDKLYEALKEHYGDDS